MSAAKYSRSPPDMRVLVDACIPVRFARSIAGHDAVPARKLGWHDLKNGKLLTAAQEQFAVMVTADRSLLFQQDLGRYQLAVVVLRARDNTLPSFLPMVGRLLDALPHAPKGRATVVVAAGFNPPDLSKLPSGVLVIR